MSEKQTNNFSIDTYLSKQEGYLLENIRRYLQAETKIVLLESALQDMYKKNEELTKQLETVNITLEQSINGLTAVTSERNDLEKLLLSTRAELNQALIYKNEVNLLNEKINTLTTDYSTLKQNYDIVLEEYNKLLPAKEISVKRRKVKGSEHEWTDGQY